MRMLKPRPPGPARPEVGPARREVEAASLEVDAARPEVAPVAAPATPARRTRPLALVTPQPTMEVPAVTPAAITAPAAALQHTHSFVGLLGQSLSRSMANAAASAAVLPLATRPQTGAELLELQGAVLERLLQLQQDWWQGWTAWVEEFGQLRRADTLSEHMEQQYNLAAQFGALFKAQASDLVDLQDTVQVDYGYWVSRKLRAP
jgi:hypothetical protein